MNNLAPGLYKVRQPATKNGFYVEHFGILDVGNTLKYLDTRDSRPIIIHQTPPNIRADILSDTDQWIVVKRIADVPAAASRIQEAFRTPSYDLFGNNCEHFARFVADGQKTSGQVATGLGMAAVCAIGVSIVMRQR